MDAGRVDWNFLSVWHAPNKHSFGVKVSEGDPLLPIVPC